MWKSLRGSKVVDWNKQQVKDTATAMLGALPIQARQIIENGSFKGPDIMKIEKKRNPTVTDIKKNGMWIKPLVTAFRCKVPSV